MEEKSVDRGPRHEAAHRPPPERRAESRLGRVHVLYDRFEQFVAIVLSLLIAVIVAVALIELVRIVLYMIETESLNPLQQQTFQLVFGMIMTLLIALEFRHAIIKVAPRHEGIIQVRTVILIALIALARKFVILDPGTGPATIGALAMALRALGVVYWLMRERDDQAALRRHEAREDDARDAKPLPPGAARG